MILFMHYIQKSDCRLIFAKNDADDMKEIQKLFADGKA